MTEVPDRLPMVDHALHRVITGFIGRVRDIIRTDDHNEQVRLHHGIAADLLLLRAYLSEVYERDLSIARLPKFNAAVKAADAITSLNQKADYY
jgi:hypothetical protein